MNNFNVELIKIFLAVSKFHSFSRAGNFLYLDPSTVSKKIRQLEKMLNQQLFIRNTQGVELTTEGLNFKNNAQQLLLDLKNLNLQPKIDWNVLRIGLLDNIAAYHYPELVAKRLNEVKLFHITVRGIDLVQQFNDGELDAIIINEESHQGISGEFLETKLRQEPFGVVTNKEINLPNSISLNDLDPTKLIIAPRYCPVSQQLLNIFDSADDIKQIGHTNTLLEVVAISDYQTILPWQMAQNLIKNDHRFQVSKLVDFPLRTISLFTRNQEVQSFLVSQL